MSVFSPTNGLGATVSAIVGFVVAPFLGRVMATLGIAIVNYTGGRAVFDQLKGVLDAQINALGGDVFLWLGVLKVDIAFSIILSAVAVRMLTKATVGIGAAAVPG